jgi:5-methylcytosine-specific restriction protein A
LLAGIGAQVGEALQCSGVRGFGDDSLLLITAAIESVGRQIDALRVAAAAEVADRSRPELGSDRLSTKKGCRSASELLQRVTLVAGPTANRRLRIGSQLRTEHSLLGQALPPTFPAVAVGLAAGALGIDSAEAILSSLSPTLHRAALNDVQVAEAELVAAATGRSGDTPVPATADEIRMQASVWKPVLDPDGGLPDDERAMHERGLRLGRPQGGTIPVSGRLLPEIGGQLQRLFDAYLSPKTAPVAFRTEEESQEDREKTLLERDDRTADQQRHDVLAVILGVAARSAEVPTIGGAAPTVLVTVREHDLSEDHGVGWIDGVDVPASMAAVKQIVCAGGTQLVAFGDSDAIVALGVPDRCFNRAQRRAITARDGGCLIPGCDIPASWTEIHHVIPHTSGGKTHVDNGVLLCWFHHRTIEISGWQIRMLDGVPQIKAPPWLDPGGGKWRNATKSRTRMADALEQRMGQRDCR